MSLPNYLTKIKSSGIYRFTFDKSEVAGVDAEILRLVVGYSEKGPFNTPVYIQNVQEFKNIFGDISKKLEKRGVYFHRLAQQALGAGPILALNLKKFKNEKVTAASFNINDLDAAKSIEDSTLEIPVEAVYDTSRFWRLAPEVLPDYVDPESGQKPLSNYIALASTDSSDASCSIIMRGYHPTGYDVTLSTWYSVTGEEMPEYLADYADMYVSDLFAEVYVFRGEFTPQLVTTEPLNKYFDVVNGKVVLKEYIVNAFGDKVDTLPLLAADDASNFVNSYSGILLPFFKNQQGQYISLDLVFNVDNPYHKLMMNFNADALYDGVFNVKQLRSTGWDTPDGDTAINPMMSISNLKKTVSAGSFKNTAEDRDDAGAVVGYKYQLVYEDETGHEATAFAPDFITFTIDSEETKHTKQKVINGALFTYTGKESIPVGDPAVETECSVYESAVGFIYPIESTSTFYVKKVYCVETAAEDDYPTVTGLYFYTENGELLDATENITDYIEDPATWEGTFTVADAAEQVAAALETGDRLVVSIDDNNEVVTYKGIETRDDKKYVVYTFNGEDGEIELAENVKIVKCNHSCSVTCANVQPSYFKGYIYESAAPDKSKGQYGKVEWQNDILSALTEYEGIRIGLTNRKDIDYRYLVDTFEAYVTEEGHKELSLIAKEKDNAVAFINWPSAHTFKNCDYASFTDEKGRFQIKYVRDGRNKQKPASHIFTTIDEVNGASYVSYNTPVVFTDGTVKTYVPAAALVSNNFMQKYLSRQPYYIVAGPTYGRLIASGLVGPDFNYSRADLDILEPMGCNVSVFVPRIGTYINSNQTAKQNPVTALSKLNIRELVIYLQDEIEKLLQSYQWEFNTQELRDRIKEKADYICENIKNNQGLYDYLNVCDESNNTPEVIDNEMMILRTEIEPARGMGKMVHELTIHKTGGMSSTVN